MKFVIQKMFNKNNIIPALITVVALVFRLFLLRYRFAVSYDEVNFIKLALGGANEGFAAILHTYWSPLYPLLGSLAIHVIPDAELAMRLTSVFWGTALVVLFYGFVKSMAGENAARVVALLIALNPGLAFLSTAIMSEALYIFCMTSGVFAGWAIIRKPTIKLMIIPGLCFGLAYLTRPEGAGLVLLMVGVLCLTALFRKGETLKLFAAAAVILVVALGIAFPYVNYLHEESGEWTLSAKGKANQLGEAILAQYEGEEKEAFLLLTRDNQRLLMDQIFHQGNFLDAEVQSESPEVSRSVSHIVHKYVSNLFDVFMRALPELLAPFWGVLIVLGLFAQSWSREALGLNVYLFVFIGAYWFGMVPLFHVNLRYLIPFLPFCLIWAGKGYSLLAANLKKTIETGINRPFSKLQTSILSVLIFAAIIFPETGRILNTSEENTERWGDPVEEKAAGEWIKENSTISRPVIMSAYHTADYYAGNDRIEETVCIPKNEIHRVLEYARFRGVNYMVMSDRYSAEYKNLSMLLDESYVPQGFRKVYDSDAVAGLRTVIFQIEQGET